MIRGKDQKQQKLTSVCGFGYRPEWTMFTEHETKKMLLKKTNSSGVQCKLWNSLWSVAAVSALTRRPGSGAAQLPRLDSPHRCSPRTMSATVTSLHQWAGPGSALPAGPAVTSLLSAWRSDLWQLLDWVGRWCFERRPSRAVCESSKSYISSATQCSSWAVMIRAWIPSFCSSFLPVSTSTISRLHFSSWGGRQLSWHGCSRLQCFCRVFDLARTVQNVRSVSINMSAAAGKEWKSCATSKYLLPRQQVPEYHTATGCCGRSQNILVHVKSSVPQNQHQSWIGNNGFQRLPTIGPTMRW